MIFGGIQRTSTLDFPGMLSCVLFTRGCDLDCFYCHNRDLIEGTKGERVEESAALAFLEKRQGLLDGVVISGGEPALQKDLPAFLNKARALGYKIKLDTNGQHTDVVRALLAQGLLDYVAVDVKAPRQEFASVCGKNGFAATAQTLALLAESGIPYEARTTLYPGFSLLQLQTLLKSLPEMPRWRLNYFRMPALYKPEDAERLRLPALTPAALEEAKGPLLALQPNLIL